MAASLDDLRRLYQRSATTRLTSLFEWDKRFATKCFEEEIHPKFSHLLKKHLAEQESKLTQFFINAEEEEGAATKNNTNYTVKVSTVETFVTHCSPTDTHSGENILLAADFLVLFLAIKEFALHNRQSPEMVNRVLSSLSEILKGAQDKQAEEGLGYDTGAHSVGLLLEWAQRFRSQLKRRVELESSAGSHSQLEHFHQSLDVTLQAIMQESIYYSLLY